MLAMARYGTRDIRRAKAFYDIVLATLGARRIIDRHGLIGYRGGEGPVFLIGTPVQGEANVGNGTQMGFAAPSRQAVDEAHAAAIRQGGTCLGPPGPRGEPGTGLYAAYFRDPDGNKIMVLHTDAAWSGATASGAGLHRRTPTQR